MLITEPDRVVVKLNRRAPLQDRTSLLAVLSGGFAVALALLVWLVPLPVHPLAAVLVWLAITAVAVYLVPVEATLVATTSAGAFVEHRGPIGTRRFVVCPPGSAQSVSVRGRVDLESDFRPFEATEVIVHTSKGAVVLCTFAEHDEAIALARAFAKVFGCSVSDQPPPLTHG